LKKIINFYNVGNAGLMWFTGWGDQAVDQGGCGYTYLK
jgi:hypothetical protein